MPQRERFDAIVIGVGIIGTTNGCELCGAAGRLQRPRSEVRLDAMTLLGRSQ